MAIMREDKPKSLTVIYKITTGTGEVQEIEVPVWMAADAEAYFASKTNKELSTEIARAASISVKV